MENTSKSDSSQINGADDATNYGYDMYPERKQARPYTWKNQLFKLQGRENIEIYKCEKQLVKVIKQSPVVRIMLSALEKAGCPISFRRHLNCEFCEPVVTGGYDPVFNQIVICYNMTRSYGMMESVVFHELIHMFDYCTGNLDFKNIDHLACTEVRAANLTYCNYTAAFIGDLIPRSKLKKQHKECVKKRAIQSVLSARPVSHEEAVAAVEKVFTKCYNDMEPVGRQIKGNPVNGDLAYSEAYLLGYD